MAFLRYFYEKMLPRTHDISVQNATLGTSQAAFGRPFDNHVLALGICDASDLRMERHGAFVAS
jgi:hypothetical protein